jgi:hypothetical protein
MMKVPLILLHVKVVVMFLRKMDQFISRTMIQTRQRSNLTNALLPGVVKNQLCDSCTEKGVTKMMIVLVTVAKPQNRIIDFHTGVIITNIQILHSSRGNDIWSGNCAIFCERASARTK